VCAPNVSEEVDVIHLDGNSIAGTLEVLFGHDMTEALGVCGGCGARRQVGALHVYRAAGIVVRCPDCEAVLMQIVEAPERTWVSLRGVSSLQLSS
jgi:Family of unknown function (DUF6510)